MKTLRKFCLLFVLFFVYVYTISIDNIPKNISIFEGEQIHLSTLWGVEVIRKDDSIETSSNLETTIFQHVGNQEFVVSLFDKINLKTINIQVMEEVEVIPVGEVVGVKLYTSGVLVVGTSTIEGQDGNIYRPFEGTGIQEGDSIIKVNQNRVNNTEELIAVIQDSQGKSMKVTYITNGEEKTCEITPIKDNEDNYKIGLWVRDSAAGVGTITFYHEETNSFAALGHAITDIDTGEIINTASGEIDDVNIMSIVKGTKEEPGKIQGSLKNNVMIGNIYKNTKYGIYGVIKNAENLSINPLRKMKVASRQEIKQGNAKILCNVDNQIKEYDIEIEKIYVNNNYDNKSMLIKVTDEELIQKTGGIVQGMSGSPIIQDGKFIGAITHVFVNDPQIGYAVFGDIMVNQLSQVN